jgi:hypothetical protein
MAAKRHRKRKNEERGHDCILGFFATFVLFAAIKMATEFLKPL